MRILAGMILTPDILLQGGFELTPNSVTHYSLGDMDNVSVCFYGWNYMIISVGRIPKSKYLKGHNLTVEQLREFYFGYYGRDL